MAEQLLLAIINFKWLLKYSVKLESFGKYLKLSLLPSGHKWGRGRGRGQNQSHDASWCNEKREEGRGAGRGGNHHGNRGGLSPKQQISHREHGG